jgi:tetraacyldisaccharide 4'-kinase
MMRTAPAFWARPPGLLSELLLPVGTGWEAVGRLRQAFARPYCPPVPVVCVGNLVTGGAGKTPVTLALATHLVSCGIAVHIVTRGYGGRLGGPVRIDTAVHDAAAVGDEALLLTKGAPCWVARHRADGARSAVAAGAQMVVLDDGLQNPGIAKTLSFLVVDAAYGFGNGRVIPAGPLRESLARGLSRADAIVLLGADAQPSSLESVGIGRALPVLHAVLRPVAGERLAGARLLAFAGIGRPEKFFTTLRELGAELVGTRAFPDHHRYRAGQIDRLLRAAERASARLVTTAKDIVRVPPQMRTTIEVLEVEIRWADPAALVELLRAVVGDRCPTRPHLRERVASAARRVRVPPLGHPSNTSFATRAAVIAAGQPA